MARTVVSRVASVDFLRGATVAFMIIANNPGDAMNVYRELVHARWHGWTAVDFIFPLFLFLVGVSVGLAASGHGDPSGRTVDWGRAFRRAGILFFFGLVVNGFPRFHLDTLRVPGVLQRIALVYLAALWLHTRLGRGGLLGVIGGILLGYWLLWAFVPVPGLGRPSLDVGYNLEGWLDQYLLRGHIWEYDTTWDPEGFLSTLPCVALAGLGVLGGRWLKGGAKQGVGAILAWGLAIHLAGLAWDAWFPINKLITTSSFVLFVGGVGLMSLGAAHRLLDARPVRPWMTPVLSLGRHALMLFVLSQLLTKVLYVTKVPLPLFQGKSLHFWLFDGLLGWMPDRQAASVLWAVALLAALTAFAMLLDRVRPGPRR